jgi:hypothetical protein
MSAGRSFRVSACPGKKPGEPGCDIPVDGDQDRA